MRTYDDQASVLDIVLAAEAIAEFTAGLSLREFTGNSLVASAVQHQLLILGEAVKRLSPEFLREHESVDWSGAARTRDVLIHHYEEVKLDEVWRIVSEDVPLLKDYLMPLVPRED